MLEALNKVARRIVLLTSIAFVPLFIRTFILQPKGPMLWASVAASQPSTMPTFPAWDTLFLALVIFDLAAICTWFETDSRLSQREIFRAKNGLCVRCGYDLRGSIRVCPECGQPFRGERE